MQTICILDNLFRVLQMCVCCVTVKQTDSSSCVAIQTGSTQNFLDQLNISVEKLDVNRKMRPASMLYIHLKNHEM